MSFKSKVVVVTGSSGGIGAAIATSFSKEGADVVVVGRNQDKLNKIAEQCQAYGPTPLVIKADVSIDEDAERVIAETVQKYGKLDVLVNNAGFLKISSIVDGTFMEAFDEMQRTNLRAVANMLQLATPHLIASKGNVINISSVVGKKIQVPQYTAYGVLKAAVDHLTSGAALELGKYGVRVNSISPGPVRTDLFSGAGIHVPLEDLGVKTVLDRWSDPEEIANLALYVASDKARGVVGSDLTLDNGFLLVN